jgi:hypothetical protein
MFSIVVPLLPDSYFPMTVFKVINRCFGCFPKEYELIIGLFALKYLLSVKMAAGWGHTLAPATFTIISIIKRTEKGHTQPLNCVLRMNVVLEGLGKVEPPAPSEKVSY